MVQNRPVGTRLRPGQVSAAGLRILRVPASTSAVDLLARWRQWMPRCSCWLVPVLVVHLDMVSVAWYRRVVDGRQIHDATRLQYHEHRARVFCTSRSQQQASQPYRTDQPSISVFTCVHHVALSGFFNILPVSNDA